MTSVTSTSDSTRAKRRVENIASTILIDEPDLWSRCQWWPMACSTCVTATRAWNDCHPTLVECFASNLPAVNLIKWSSTTQAHEMSRSTVRSTESPMPAAPWCKPEAHLCAACCISHTTIAASRMISMTRAGS